MRNIGSGALRRQILVPVAPRRATGAREGGNKIALIDVLDVGWASGINKVIGLAGMTNFAELTVGNSNQAGGCKLKSLIYRLDRV